MSNPTDTIPTANPQACFLQHKSEYLEAIERVIESGWYILGQEVKSFEREFAEYCGATHAIGVANGTDAVSLALQALGVGPGSKVITVSHSAVATVAAIERIGAIPVFCDIDTTRRTLDPSQLTSLIDEHTRAIVPVHIYGQPADIESICAIAKQNNLVVVEDCAQAHGAYIGDRHVGTFGDAAAFSFYPTKNLGAIGDGGAIITSNERVASEIRALREYGWRERYISSIPGTNSRLDELQAAVLRIGLRHLPGKIERRRFIASQYNALFQEGA
ncbi:MAG: DegT/DnrJ/EryC1/StrS family aminotransferase, partial [Bdellovibrionales bacterium]|nr:DegT/DnrJ/EryC1/StrS family aminotransferase [Bdellovibrionales bacterium]